MYYYPNNAAGSFMQQQIQSQATPSYYLKGRPVSSLEEVRAAQIDFDGSLFVFPDLAHNRIYTKQISMDGSASLNMYELTQIPTSVQSNIEINNFVTHEEFESAINQLRESLQPAKDTQAGTAQFNF